MEQREQPQGRAGEWDAGAAAVEKPFQPPPGERRGKEGRREGKKAATNLISKFSRVETTKRQGRERERKKERNREIRAAAGNNAATARGT